MSEKTWGGRFAARTEKIVEAFTSSVAFDKRLYAYDIEGSTAHCRMLARQGVLSEDEAGLLIEGLAGIRRQIARGQIPFDDSLEDIHTHIEARLIEEVGQAARRLHTARSRNDQVALDMRMYLRAETRQVLALMLGMQKALLDMADAHMETAMPGYTHLQRAQPVLLAHHLLAYFEMLQRDVERMRQCLQRIDVMPLGAAALAGTPYPIDRDYTARLLGFAQVSANSMDAVSDRDFIIEFVAAASICMVHLSRLSEEMILWASSEFGFVELPDAFATGSSIMPQKKNPDVAELVRGKCGRVVGDLVNLLMTLKGLPLTYNRDLQEDKPPLFDTVDTLKSCLEIYQRMLPHVKVHRRRMAQAAAGGFLNATDMADYLVSKGVPFREAHGIVGKAVSYALEQGRELNELSLEELRGFAGQIEADVYEHLTVEAMIGRRRCMGGTATGTVRAALQAAGERLAAAARDLEVEL